MSTGVALLENGQVKVDVKKNDSLLKSSEFKLYLSYTLSRWGDRMWLFALSIVLGSIGNHNLQLTAICGFLNSVAVLAFAAHVGRWIDRTPRLKAATTVLIINNFSVALSATFLMLILLEPSRHYFDLFGISKDHPIIINTLIYLSIFLCAISTLASCGAKICISKDWVVVISGNDKDKLAAMNAWMVRLDLTSMILSPLIAGQIMTSFGRLYGCIYIALWNVVSFFFEYFALRSLYTSCPTLALKSKKKNLEKGEKNQNLDENNLCDLCNLPVVSCVHSEDVQHLFPNTDEKIIVEKRQSMAKNGNLRRSSVLRRPIDSIFKGWKVYYRQQPTFFAGLGLALLYLTVLGLDGITTVYVYSQGLRENAVALSRGAGAIIGIAGSFAFPKLRRRFGVEKTGVWALFLQILCNLFAVVSVFLPGSPFDPIGYFTERGAESEIGGNLSKIDGNGLKLDDDVFAGAAQNTPKVSIVVFLIGIVFARFGLWMADLAITQIMQENIADTERGVVNGVQHAANQCLNMIKDILVIMLPDPRTFGLLIIVSCCSVSCGFASFLVYVKKATGHSEKKKPINGDARPMIGDDPEPKDESEKEETAQK